VREAIIALEVQGLVEVRIGSGAYVLRLPGSEDAPGFDTTAFEVTEARLLFESEAAALAATQVTDEDLAEIQCRTQIAAENLDPNGTDRADRAFHLAIARATRNTAVFKAVENLWALRASSPEAALMHEKARSANIKPVVEEHTAIFQALRARSGCGPRGDAHASVRRDRRPAVRHGRARPGGSAPPIAAKRTRYARATA
jgi:GntR family transcriptional repressor for pyruvate dehydrogenase complex